MQSKVLTWMQAISYIHFEKAGVFSNGYCSDVYIIILLNIELYEANLDLVTLKVYNLED